MGINTWTPTWIKVTPLHKSYYNYLVINFIQFTNPHALYINYIYIYCCLIVLFPWFLISASTTKYNGKRTCLKNRTEKTGSQTLGKRTTSKGRHVVLLFAQLWFLHCYVPRQWNPEQSLSPPKMRQFPENGVGQVDFPNEQLEERRFPPGLRDTSTLPKTGPGSRLAPCVRRFDSTNQWFSGVLLYKPMGFQVPNRFSGSI